MNSDRQNSRPAGNVQRPNEAATGGRGTSSAGLRDAALGVRTCRGRMERSGLYFHSQRDGWLVGPLYRHSTRPRQMTKKGPNRGGSLWRQRPAEVARVPTTAKEPWGGGSANRAGSASI